MCILSNDMCEQLIVTSEDNVRCESRHLAKSRLALTLSLQYEATSYESMANERIRVRARREIQRFSRTFSGKFTGLAHEALAYARKMGKVTTCQLSETI